MAEQDESVVQRFWGMRLSAGKPFTLTLTRTELHVTQVTASGDADTTVKVSTNLMKDIRIAHLPKGVQRQALLDINFFPDDESVTFEATAEVYLAGSIAIFGGVLEVSDDEEEDAGASAAATTKAAAAAAKSGASGAERPKEKLTAAQKLKRAREDSKPAAASGADFDEEAQQRSAKQVRAEKQTHVGDKAASSSSAGGKADSSAAAASGGAGSGSSSKPSTPGGGEAPMQEMAEGMIAYRELRVGSGDKPKRGRKVLVAYEGRLRDGTVFDSSPKFTFRLGVGEVIPGWDRGVATMSVGGKRRLVIHPKMAYGAQGAPPTIPPNATLTFDVELLKVL